ncbi:hypothetical protein BGX38DRAFT_669455 [Terfezia claveryi]|nr:hypothetical protein BGX38DRAFT_669455 [Terfezia claveryi]
MSGGHYHMYMNTCLHMRPQAYCVIRSISHFVTLWRVVCNQTTEMYSVISSISKKT